MRALLRVLILLLGLTGSVEAATPRACVVAASPDSAVDILSGTPALKARVLAYRQAWRAFCQGGPSRPALETLLAEAKRLESESLGNAAPGAAAQALAGAAGRLLPAMSQGEGDSVVADTAAFREAALALGTAADRFFWSRYPKGTGHLPPWISATWDYGGCWRFGAHAWLPTVKSMGELRDVRLEPAYESLRKIEDDILWSGLTEDKDVCTCGPTAAVAPDLEAILRFVRARPPLKDKVAPLEAQIQAIKSGAVKVRSEAEGHCSGG